MALSPSVNLLAQLQLTAREEIVLPHRPPRCYNIPELAAAIRAGSFGES
jgi:hypothetical protein